MIVGLEALTQRAPLEVSDQASPTSPLTGFLFSGEESGFPALDERTQRGDFEELPQAKKGASWLRLMV